MYIPTTTLTQGGAVFQSYTPVLTASGSNPTLGVGAIQKGQWSEQGKLATVFVEVRFGSSGAAAGTGEYTVSLPFTLASGVPIFCGSGVLFDSSASDSYAVMCEPVQGGSTTKLWVAQTLTAAVTGAANPFAWDVNDGIFFEAAFIIA